MVILDDNVKVYQPNHHEDFRGDIWTSWEDTDMYPKLNWRRDKFSTSSRNVLRGLHGDVKSHKLISCVYGEVYFVVVNPNKTKWDWTILSNKNKKQVLVPPKYCNGMYVLSHKCVLHYKYSYSGEYYDVDKQFVVKWDDVNLNIEWPSNNPILYGRDIS
tara:strand:- start:1206 stop:1682 length:477 start_codon:yes stop_codon:yes gene_type:complete